MTSHPSIAVLMDYIFDYQRELLRGIEARLARGGFRSVTYLGKCLQIPGREEPANRAYHHLNPAHHQGVIVLASSLGEQASDLELGQFYQGFSPLPVVTIGRETPGFPVVQMDDQEGMRVMMHHLLTECHYRRFVFIRGKRGNVDAEQREQVFREALLAHGIDPERQILLNGEFCGRTTEQQMRKLLSESRDFEVVVCANDEMAQVALDTLQAHDLTVPIDVGVVGFDDALGSAQTQPPLTTVRQSLFMQGWHASDLLLEHLMNPEAPLCRILPTELVVRHSTRVRALTPPQEPGTWPSASDLKHHLQKAVEDRNPLVFVRALEDLLHQHSTQDEAVFSSPLLAELLEDFKENLPAVHLPDLQAVVFQARQMLARRKHFRTHCSTLVPGRSFTQLHRLELQLTSQAGWEGFKGQLQQHLDWHHIQQVTVVRHTPTENQLFSTHPDARTSPEASPHDLLPVNHSLLLPLFSRGQHHGTLLIDSHQAQHADIEHLQYVLASALGQLHFVEQQRLHHQELERNLQQQTTEVKALQGHLHKLAVFDELTGLVNKSQFTTQLETLIHGAHTTDRHGYAVLFLDVDGFKNINDTYGHRTGDLFLKALGERLQSTLRPYDIVARFGGDEFAVLLQHISGLNTVLDVIGRIQRDLSRSCVVAGQTIQTSISIGVVQGDARYRGAEEVLRDADIAMYAAKRSGNGQHRIFEVQMHQQVSKRTQLEIDLRQALQEEGLTVHYQPILHHSGKLKGFEALARWMHPQKGFISPAEFIPIAEETGLVLALDRQVLRQACQDLQSWKGHPELSSLQLSVNLSTLQFSQTDLPAVVQQVLQDTGFPPQHLNLEITESLLAERAERVLENIRQLQALGVNLHIDDFGTGYSSLGYLQQFQASALKIDRSFIFRLHQDPKCAELVRTIITMAHNLGMQVVAEGVEEKVHQQWLAQAGCEFLQGYLFSRPLPAGQVKDWLNTQLGVVHGGV